MTDVAVDPRAAYPVPPSRGRWTVNLAARARGALTWTPLGPIIAARSRRLTTGLDTPSQFTFTIDGRDPSAAQIRELEHEVYVYRWDENAGVDRPYFRGVICHSQDIISEQSHSVNFTSYDYLWLLGRRFLTQELTFTNADQDYIVNNLVLRVTTNAQSSAAASGNWNLAVGAAMPLQTGYLDPAGNARAVSGRLRIRRYVAQKQILEAIEQLAAVINGFDFGVVYNPTGTDTLGVYYPYRGVTNSFPLLYGSTVAGVSRSFNANDYNNYWRTMGDPATTYAESFTSEANSASNRAGLWMGGDSMADVTDSSTLSENVFANLGTTYTPHPTYSLTMRPDAWYHGAFGLGDTLTVTVNSGRLAGVQSQVRIVGVTYVIGDDGQEDIEVDAVKTPPTFMDPVWRNARGLAALQRR